VQTIVANRPNRRFLYAAVGGVVLLAAAWSSPGLAAAHAAIGCDRVAEDLRSLNVDSLTVEVVDLSDVSASPENSDNLTESVAPLLFLTPRVATILQDVFDDSDRAKPIADPVLATDSPKKQETAASPVVDNAGAERAEPSLPMYEHAAILPRFQRQMYRTDI
jgi:hypothetical protein